MGPEVSTFLILVVLSLAMSAALFLLLLDGLRDLLRNTVTLEAGVAFYLRSFFLVLFLSSLSAALGTSFDLKPDARFMEFVWKAAAGLSSMLERMLWFLATYLILVTILVATRKIRNDK